ncbi:hypothetical protein NDA10_000805 [Ustilago hordei]|nr:hypothetical protein NDA10_000805 [Ustilago hordei]
MTTQMDHRTGDLKSVQANLADGEVKNEEAYQWGKPGPNSDMWCTIASAHHVSLDQQPNNWIVDSRATDHVTNDKSNLSSSLPCTGFVKTTSGTKICIVAVGQAMLRVNGHKVLLDNILYVPDSNAKLILDCVVSKSTKAQMGHGSGTHAKDPLELIHIDLAMHWSMKTEVTCLLVTIDDASSFTYVKPLQTKSDALQVLKEWIQYAEVSAVAISWQNDAGFQWQKTSPYTSKQNGHHIHEKPSAKCRKLGTIPSGQPDNLVRYDEEHKGWKFLSPNHNLLVFWSNSACFLQNRSWNDCTDMTQIQDMDALHYSPGADTTDLSYDDVNMHDKELQQPLDDVYCPTQEQDMFSRGETTPPELADTTLDHLDGMTDMEPVLTTLTIPSNQASDSTVENGYQLEMSSASPPPIRDLACHTQDSTFSKYSSIQNVQYYHNKFATMCEMYPWLHLTTLTKLLCIYPRMFLPAAKMHQFQEKLQHHGKLANIRPILEYNTNVYHNANVYTFLVMNLKPSVKEALTGPNQIHWCEAIKAEMDGLESMHIWETVDWPKDMNLMDSKLVLQVKTDASNVPYKFKARF